MELDRNEHGTTPNVEIPNYEVRLDTLVGATALQKEEGLQSTYRSLVRANPEQIVIAGNID